jgi:hypothetical protein
MSDVTEADKKIIGELQQLLDQVYEVRRGLLKPGFSPVSRGCVCEGTALCAHHSAVYDHLVKAADSLALAIQAAGRVE